MSEIITKDEKLQKSLDVINAFKSKINLIGSQCLNIRVKDDATLSVAQQNLSKATQMVNFIEEKRKEVKAPYLASGTLIDNTCKEIVKIISEGVAHIKSEVKSWELAKKKEQEEKQAKIDADLAAQKQAIESVLLTKEVIEDIKQKEVEANDEKERLLTESMLNKTRGIRYSWKFEVEDKSLVPPEWLMVDESAVKAWMKENKDKLKDGKIVSGIKFIKDIIVTA